MRNMLDSQYGPTVDASSSVNNPFDAATRALFAAMTFAPSERLKRPVVVALPEVSHDITR